MATAAVAAAARSTCVRANVGVGTPHVMLLWVSDARGVDLSPTQPNAAALSAQVKLFRFRVSYYDKSSFEAVSDVLKVTSKSRLEDESSL